MILQQRELELNNTSSKAYTGLMDADARPMTALCVTTSTKIKFL